MDRIEIHHLFVCIKILRRNKFCKSYHYLYISYYFVAVIPSHPQRATYRSVFLALWVLKDESNMASRHVFKQLEWQPGKEVESSHVKHKCDTERTN